MNLICNNCVGARMYDLSNTQFNNPFTWCSIDLMDFVNIIHYFNQIDFYKINTFFEIRLNGQQTICCELERGIKLHYVHYIYKNCEIEKHKPDVYGKNILQYFSEKYYTRLDRMKQKNEQPTFLLSLNYTSKTHKDYMKCINELLNMDNPNIYILAHKDNASNIINNGKTNLFLIDDNVMNLGGVDFTKKYIQYFFHK